MFLCLDTPPVFHKQISEGCFLNGHGQLENTAKTTSIGLQPPYCCYLSIKSTHAHKLFLSISEPNKRVVFFPCTLFRCNLKLILEKSLQEVMMQYKSCHGDRSVPSDGQGRACLRCSELLRYSMQEAVTGAGRRENRW